MSCTITATDFKDQFDRGQFIYGTTIETIRDKDIDNAISEASAVFNGDLYPVDPEATDPDHICKLALNYLTAHFLQLDTEAVDSGGVSKYNVGSHSADGISESFAIPEWMNQGVFAFYASTYYGQKYLILSKPYIDGAVYVVGGATLP